MQLVRERSTRGRIQRCAAQEERQASMQIVRGEQGCGSYVHSSTRWPLPVCPRRHLPELQLHASAGGSLQRVLHSMLQHQVLRRTPFVRRVCGRAHDASAQHRLRGHVVCGRSRLLLASLARAYALVGDGSLRGRGPRRPSADTGSDVLGRAVRGAAGVPSSARERVVEPAGQRAAPAPPRQPLRPVLGAPRHEHGLAAGHRVGVTPALVHRSHETAAARRTHAGGHGRIATAASTHEVLDILLQTRPSRVSATQSGTICRRQLGRVR